MIVHRPYLSAVTGFSMLGVLCFYTVICWQGHKNKPSAAEIKARKVSRARKKKEELAKREEEATRRRIAAKEIKVAKSRDFTNLKKRNKKTETDDVEMESDSDSPSGSEQDSQTER